MNFDMGATFYKILRTTAKLVRIQTIRQTCLNAHRADRDDGFILACTHLSHLEPIVLSAAIRRQVHWMARKEFYENRLSAFILNASGAIQIDRFGSPMPGIRAAARVAAEGKCIGIFPEGGVAQGSKSVLRGGPIKSGVCTIAIQADVPVVPAVILGTDKLTSVKSWIPFSRTPLCFAFGNDIRPPALIGSRRTRRIRMTKVVEHEFQQIYVDLITRLGINDSLITQVACDHSSGPLL